MKLIRQAALAAMIGAAAVAGHSQDRQGQYGDMNQGGTNSQVNPNNPSMGVQTSQPLTSKNKSALRKAERRLQEAKQALQKDRTGINLRAIASIDAALQEIQNLRSGLGNTGTVPNTGGGTSGSEGGVLMTPGMTPGTSPNGVTGTPGTDMPVPNSGTGGTSGTGGGTGGTGTDGTGTGGTGGTGTGGTGGGGY